MIRNAMKRTLIQTLLCIIVSQRSDVDGFILRSPLYMSNGDNQIETYDESQGKKTSLSISTSTSPLAPTAATATDESIKKRSLSTRQRTYREKGRPTKVKKITTPLVDSTLLRFLSAQKNQIAAQERKSINDPVIVDDSSNINEQSKRLEKSVSNQQQSNVRPITQYRSTMNDTELIQSMTENLLMMESKENNNATSKVINGVGNEVVSSVESSSLQQVKDTTADSISWFTQYSEQNVAKKLISIGASEDAAKEAGSAVQNYSLTRTTRQRVRQFLSERDSILALSSQSTIKGRSDSLDENRKYLPNTFDFEDSSSGYSYNIDNVINVLTDAGLTGKDIAAIFSHTPSVSMMQTKLGMDVPNKNAEKSNFLEDSLDRAYHGVLCSTIKLRKYDARKVLRGCPGLLTKRGSTSSSEVISILSNLGISPTSLCRDKAALPILLSRSPASLFRLVAFLSSDAVRMPVNRIGQLIRRSNCACLLDHIAPLTQKTNIDSALTVETFLNSGSNAMELEIKKRYKTMFRTAKFLRRKIGIQNLGRSLSAYPKILTLDIEEQIAPCVEFLNDEVELFEEEIPRVLEIHPQLLGANIDQMRKNVEYFRSLEVADEDLGSIFRSFPSLLILDIKKMTKVVDFLKEVGVSNIGRFVTRLPPVLGYSVEDDLLPKWQYLKKVRHYASFEISRFPAYFSYPLDRVIKCRYNYLQNVKQLPVKYFPIDEVLRYGDRDFAIAVAKDDDETEYLAFANDNTKKKQRNTSQRKQKKTLKDVR